MMSRSSCEWFSFWKSDASNCWSRIFRCSVPVHCREWNFWCHACFEYIYVSIEWLSETTFRLHLDLIWQVLIRDFVGNTWWSCQHWKLYACQTFHQELSWGLEASSCHTCIFRPAASGTSWWRFECICQQVWSLRSWSAPSWDFYTPLQWSKFSFQQPAWSIA